MKTYYVNLCICGILSTVARKFQRTFYNISTGLCSRIKFFWKAGALKFLIFGSMRRKKLLSQTMIILTSNSTLTQVKSLAVRVQTVLLALKSENYVIACLCNQSSPQKPSKPKFNFWHQRTICSLTLLQSFARSEVI